MSSHLRGGVVLGWGDRARPQQGYEACSHHERADLHGGESWGRGSYAVHGGLPLLGTEGDLPRPLLGGGSARIRESIWQGSTSTCQRPGCRCGRRAASPGTCAPRCPGCGGHQACPPRCTCRGRRCAGRGVAGGEEGVRAVHKASVCWCVVVGGGEGVVFVVHEGHVRGGGRLAGVRGWDVGLDVLPEVAQGGYAVNLRPPFPRHGSGRGGSGWGTGHVGHAVGGEACGCRPLQLGVSNKVRPPVDGGHPVKGKSRASVGARKRVRERGRGRERSDGT